MKADRLTLCANVSETQGSLEIKEEGDNREVHILAIGVKQRDQLIIGTEEVQL